MREAGQNRLRFGAGEGLLTQGLRRLEKNTLTDTLTKEFIGINLPKILFTRTQDERIDVAVSELGNTSAFLAGGFLADQALGLSLKRAMKNIPAETAQHQLATRWATTSRSVGIYGVVFSLMWAMPFVRNYITTKRTGSTHFTDVIGAHLTIPNQQRSPAIVQESLNHYRHQIATILGTGIGISTAALLLGVIGIRQSGNAFGKAAMTKLHDGKTLAQTLEGWHWIGKTADAAQNSQRSLLPSVRRFFRETAGSLSLKSFLLRDGRFANFSGTPALLFWGLPAYGGWIHASRDQYEKKEQWLKFGNFVACFFGPPIVMARIFAGKMKALLPEGGQSIPLTVAEIDKIADAGRRTALTRVWQQKNIASLTTSILLLGTLPQMLNIYLTRKRLQAARLQQRHNRLPMNQASYTPLPTTALPGRAPFTPTATSFASPSYTRPVLFPAIGISSPTSTWPIAQSAPTNFSIPANSSATPSIPSGAMPVLSSGSNPL